MHESYEDIKSRIPEEPLWYDCNGTPRYCEFSPHRSPNAYATWVALLTIQCQYCGEEFDVEMNGRPERRPERGWKCLHYGDPPNHDCVGDTMNCIDRRVLQAWTHPEMDDEGLPCFEWKRLSEEEGRIEERDWHAAWTPIAEGEAE